MNDTLAEQTIEDHKYLLEQVENKCAIAFFAVVNRNQSLYNALQKYSIVEEEKGEQEEKKMEGDSMISPSQHRMKEKNAHSDDPLEEIFLTIMKEFDFMSVVMYPELNNRREFVHNCWRIAKAKENEELKRAVASDP